MSINYTFEMESDIDPRSLLLRLAEITGMPLLHENVLKDEKSHLVISAYRMNDKWCIEETEKDFGFHPSTYISFTHGKKEYERNNQLMMSVVSELLNTSEGNAILVFSETPSTVLKKINSIVSIDAKWKDEPGMDLLAKNELEYKVEKLND